MIQNPGRTVLRIRLKRDDSGYPPYDSEQVLGTQVGDHLYKLETIPVFAFGLALGDVVEVRHHGKPLALWIERLEAPGSHSTIRVIALGGRNPTVARSIVEERGGWVEQTPIDGLIAIDVPPQADFEAIERELIRGQEAGLWDYSVGVLADGHKSIRLG